MADMIGHFYLRRTNSGNLIGEFSNKNIVENVTESADVIGVSTGYIGEYRSTWRENDQVIIAILSIRFKQNTNERIFILEWRTINGELIFFGEGMLCDGILIGHYTN